MNSKLRPDLPPLTPRIAKLPVDERGYPVPFFVVWVDDKGQRSTPGTGKPEFRAMDPAKLAVCVRQKRCWVCGEPLGAHKAFVLGPMCCVNQVTSEPPSHLECAEWSVKGCPFLTNPDMVRREKGLENASSPGVMIKSNPGVMAIWVTGSYKPFFVGNGVLFKVAPATSPITWWKRGRHATREEVLEAIELGLPKLLNVCRNPEETAELTKAADLLRSTIQ